MLIDLHAHTQGISWCCRQPAPVILRTAREHDMDGIVLTNHYQKCYLTDGLTAAEFAANYVKEYHYTRACGEEIGFPVFFGLEVTMERHGGVHMLIYGVEEDFPLHYPDLFDMTQTELYRLVKAHGGTMVQAHPYRQNIDRLLDVAYLDGIEINCHPVYEGTHEAALTEIARANELLLTAGGDYHADIHRATCGVYVPDEVKSSRDICDYLYAADEVRLCIQEVHEHTTHELRYRRHDADYIIRPITPADNAAVERVIRDCLIEYGGNHEGTAWADPYLGRFSEVYAKEGRAYWVAVDRDGHVVAGVGIGEMEGEDGVCELQKMYSIPAVRGTGIAARLLAVALDFAWRKKYRQCYLETLDNMYEAQRFYEKHGFVRTDHIFGATGHYACEVKYIKEIGK